MIDDFGLAQPQTITEDLPGFKKYDVSDPGFRTFRLEELEKIDNLLESEEFMGYLGQWSDVATTN